MGGRVALDLVLVCSTKICKMGRPPLPTDAAKAARARALYVSVLPGPARVRNGSLIRSAWSAPYAEIGIGRITEYNVSEAVQSVD